MTAYLIPTTQQFFDNNGDPRHASFSVFVLLAQALMEITGLVSPVNLRESPDYMMGWFIVGVATVILITWHVVIATKVRRKPDVL